jgi:hypothetical protein
MVVGVDHAEKSFAITSRKTSPACLPAGLHDAWNFALQRKAAEAQAAYAKLAQIGSRAAAQLAAIVLAGLELRLLCVFDAFCSGRHNSSRFFRILFPNLLLSPLCALAERHTETLQQLPRTVVILGRRDDRHVHALGLIDLGIINLGENQLVAQT